LTHPQKCGTIKTEINYLVRVLFGSVFMVLFLGVTLWQSFVSVPYIYSTHFLTLKKNKK